MKKKILMVVAVIAVGAGAFFITRPDPTSQSSEGAKVFFKTKQECEQQTGKKCSGPLQCDYVPEGSRIEEVCGEGFFKGAWSAQGT